MNRSDAAQEVKRRYADYLTPAKKRVQGKTTYICPLCGNGKGSTGDGLSVDPKGDGTQLKCFKCGFYGDIVDLYQQEHNTDAGTAFKALYEAFNITIDAENTTPKQPRKTAKDTNTPPAETTANTAQIESIESKPDFTNYIKACKEHIGDQRAQEYLSFRGLSNELAARFWLGYDPATGFLIIPVTKSFYIARNTDSNSKFRYNNPKGASIELFNLKALQNEAARPVFITEGAIDALSIIEAGGEALALNSVSNVRKLLEHLKAQTIRSTLIINLDSDEAGRKASKELAEGLRELNIKYVSAELSEYKDANEALIASREGLTEAVAAAERATIKPDNIADYIRQSMPDEIQGLKDQSNRKTGFKNLDAQAGSIYAGLYAVGGISSVGKTTFISQLADQMAAQGQHVLFFSMEQSRLEMVSKSIARQTYIKDEKKAISSLRIRNGEGGELVDEATEAYIASVGDRVSVIEGNFNCNVSFISDYTKQYIQSNRGVKPIVIIDYLQVLTAEPDPKTGKASADTRQNIDHNVTQLKRLSRSLDIPIFIISSVNRSNYLTPIDFEAFKESGGIEYTADVVWGLQLAIMHDPIFDKDKSIKEKREKVATAKRAMPRKIELVCLKNRYGKCNYTADFEYYPQYDYFKPILGDFEAATCTPWGNPIEPIRRI